MICRSVRASGFCMLEVDETDLPTDLSIEKILAHPRFPAARDAMLEAMLALYEHDPFLNRLLLQVGRNVMFVVIMCLHARYDVADPATWPTLQLLKQSMALFRLASPRRVADLVSRLIKTGYLEQVCLPHDRRVRILTPTEKMIEQDQDWLVSHYVPLQVLLPDPGYARIMQRDPTFQQMQRLVAASRFPLAAQVMARNPTMMQFMVREGGIMIIIKLLQLASLDGDAKREISYSDIGPRFGVSRTQVRKLLQLAEKDGLVQLTRGKGYFVRLTPKLLEAFDRFIADTMVAHDITYNLAQRAAASKAGRTRLIENHPLLQRSSAN
jgi:DNA-binding MarR family transcriptional regulator